MLIISISVFNKASIQELLTEYYANQNVKKHRTLFSD